MKIYKIDSSKISAYTNRITNRLLKIILSSMILVMVLIFYTFPNQNEPISEKLPSLLISFSFSSVLMGFLYFNNKKLTFYMAESLQIIIDDTSITRKINLDQDMRLNFIHRSSYNKAKGTSGIYEKIDFDQIKSIEKKKNEIWVKATNSNAITNSNIVVIPKEISNFEEIENILNSRLAYQQ